MKYLNNTLEADKQREEVKKKILEHCKIFNIEPPKNWGYEEVKRVGDIINEELSQIKPLSPVIGRDEVDAMLARQYDRTCGNAGWDYLSNY